MESSKRPYEIGLLIIPVLQSRKMRLSRVEKFAQDYMDYEEQSWDLNPGRLSP